MLATKNIVVVANTVNELVAVLATKNIVVVAITVNV